MDTVSRTLRFDEPLWMDLVLLAEKDKRSINNYVSLLLEDGVNRAKYGEAPPNIAKVEYSQSATMPDGLNWKEKLEWKRQQQNKK